MEVPEKSFRLKDPTTTSTKEGPGTADATISNGSDVAQVVAPLRKCGRTLGSRNMRPRK